MKDCGKRSPERTVKSLFRAYEKLTNFIYIVYLLKKTNESKAVNFNVWNEYVVQILVLVVLIYKYDYSLISHRTTCNTILVPENELLSATTSTTRSSKRQGKGANKAQRTSWDERSYFSCEWTVRLISVHSAWYDFTTPHIIPVYRSWTRRASYIVDTTCRAKRQGKSAKWAQRTSWDEPSYFSCEWNVSII